MVRMFLNLTEDNVLLYAIHYYNNPHATSTSELIEDWDRVKYIKRLFKRYLQKGILKDRLILNHIIVVYNVFGIEAATRILYYRLEPELYSVLKTFLLFLNYQPDKILGIEGKDVLSDEIPVDLNLADKLRNI